MKNKKPSQKKLNDIKWQECRKAIKEKYGPTCYTCGKSLAAKPQNYQIGHLIPKKIAHNLKFDLRILRPQCYFCNINLGGNGAIFLWKMIQEMRFDHVKQIFEDYYGQLRTKMIQEMRFDHVKQIFEDYYGQLRTAEN